MANLSAFYETRNLFIELTQWHTQLSYEEWSNSPHDHKAALLFVNFFSKMIQAWDKANRFDFIDGEDGVSIVLQYLEKNVAKIEAEPKKFSEAYIYKVAYNCMYCICHDLKSVKDRWENETSSVTVYEGEELSVFDKIADNRGSAEEELLSISEQKEFWSIVEDADPKCQKVINYLLTSDPAMLKKLTKGNKLYEKDPLRDIKVSLEEADEIIADIKDRLESAKLAEQIQERIQYLAELQERAEIDRLLSQIRERLDSIRDAATKVS